MQSLRGAAEEIGAFKPEALAYVAPSLAATLYTTAALGLLIGIQMNKSCGELVTFALNNRLLINVTADQVIRLLPPLIMNEQQIEEVAKRLILSIQQFNEQSDASE